MPDLNASGEIRAAGGIVCVRRGDHAEVLVVHRPQFDDWTLPKGKAKAGESDLDAARREVEEETGLRCEVGPEVARLHFRDRNHRTKVTRYWLMRPWSGAFRASDEVDSCDWLAPVAASAKMTRSGERDLLAALGPRIAARSFSELVVVHE